VRACFLDAAQELEVAFVVLAVALAPSRERWREGGREEGVSDATQELQVTLIIFAVALAPVRE